MTTGIGAPRDLARERRPEFDVMRLVVVVGLVFFHASLVFGSRDGFYVTNAGTGDAPFLVTGLVAALCVVWAMPLLFLIAGFGAWHSMRRRGPGGFAAERLRRLGVPFVVAMVTVAPIPQWLRLRTDPGYHESYLAFLPRFFAVRPAPADFPFVLKGTYFETGHLWFLVLLLCFSLLLAPLVRWLPRALARRLRAGPARVAALPGGTLLFGLPIAAISAAAGLEETMGGWNRWAYAVFFLYGFVLVTHQTFPAAIRRDAVPAAVAGIVLLAASVPGFALLTEPGADAFTGMTPLAAGVRALYGLAGWCLLVVILRLLDRTPSALGRAVAPDRPLGRLYGYLAPAALPLYVLHQPIVVAVAFFVVGRDTPALAEYLVIVALSLALTVAAYDVLVRRTRLTAFLFGLRRPGQGGSIRR
ncbi:acyltransferase family protein [Nonomuraea wenchangensis]|uniref:acyltransferase family protein n=1 Tax=Nonomuraea wenchangensis TaxID=568860 RepID=UPI00340ECD97